MFRPRIILLALTWLAFANAAATWGTVEFRKWSPNGAEPFYAIARGYSPDQSEMVLMRHDNSMTVRVKIAELSKEDLKYAKEFIAKAQAGGNSSGDHVSNAMGERWDLDGLVTTDLPKHARGWRFVGKSPLTFAAVGLEDPNVVVLTCMISEPIADDQAMGGYLKQFSESVSKSWKAKAGAQPLAPLTIEEVKNVPRGFVNGPRRQYEATAQGNIKGEPVTVRVRVYRDGDATVAFVSFGSVKVTDDAMECAAQFRFQPNARMSFVKRSPPPAVTNKQISEIKKAVKQLLADVKKKDAAYIYENCVHPSSLETLKQSGEYEQTLRTFDATRRAKVVQALESIKWNTGHVDQYKSDVIAFANNASNLELRFRKFEEQWRME